MKGKSLVLGTTGYLGRAFVSDLITASGLNKEQITNKYIFLGHRSNNLRTFKKDYDIEVFSVDMMKPGSIENHMINNPINRIINLAGFVPNYLSTSNEVLKCVESNFIGIYNLIRLAKSYNIKNYVGIGSTNSTNNSSFYGITKEIGEYFTKINNYTIISSPNIFGSRNSVLDLWYNQMKNNEPLTVTDPKCVRYFVDVKNIISLIHTSRTPGRSFYPDFVYSITIGDLLDAFGEFFKYTKIKSIPFKEGEILEPIFPFDSKIIKPNINELKALIKEWEASL